jgi:hypothetical protein
MLVFPVKSIVLKVLLPGYGTKYSKPFFEPPFWIELPDFEFL